MCRRRDARNVQMGAATTISNTTHRVRCNAIYVELRGVNDVRTCGRADVREVHLYRPLDGGACQHVEISDDVCEVIRLGSSDVTMCPGHLPFRRRHLDIHLKHKPQMALQCNLR